MKFVDKPKKPCYSCRNKRGQSWDVKGGHFLVFKCAVREIEFGNETDWKNGKNMPERCGQYDKQQF
jgi:hypothetical protein